MGPGLPRHSNGALKMLSRNVRMGSEPEEAGGRARQMILNREKAAQEGGGSRTEAGRRESEVRDNLGPSAVPPARMEANDGESD